MARIIKEKIEYRCTCPHCLQTVGFFVDEVYSSYVRGLEMSEGWIDCDSVWNYIDCPDCHKAISVDNVLSKTDRIMLKRKYENQK